MNTKMNTNRKQYLEEIYPRIPESLKQDILEKYDYVSLDKHKKNYSLRKCNVVMLVGLTGTGKSTTLRALHDHKTLNFTDEIPPAVKLPT